VFARLAGQIHNHKEVVWSKGIDEVFLERVIKPHSELWVDEKDVSKAG
jgi:hypothetical protein